MFVFRTFRQCCQQEGSSSSHPLTPSRPCCSGSSWVAWRWCASGPVRCAGAGLSLTSLTPDLSRLHFSHELPLASCTLAHPAIGIVSPTTAAGPSASAGPAGPIVMAEGQAMSQMICFSNAHASPRANSRGIFTSSSSSSSSGGHRLQL
jgi:hypothetical protein